MKVLRVVGSFDAEFGGPSNSASNSVIAVAQAGVETTVVFSRRDASGALDEPAVRALDEAGVDWRAFEISKGPRHFNRTKCVSLPMARWLWKHAGAYDIVHVHSPWGLHCLAALFAAKRHRRPCVLTPHECFTAFDMGQAGNRVLWALKHLLLPLYQRAFDRVIFSSRLECRDSHGNWSDQQAAVIHHPVRIPISATERPDQSDEERTFVVGFLGRLHPKKNIERLIEAITQLPSSISLRIAGDGEPTYRYRLQGIARAAGVSDRVDWCGFVSGPAKTRFLQEVDLLAMPSVYECFGMVAAEAMAAGTPVLVSPETGVAQTVTNTGAGVVVEPTGDAVARAIGGLAEDPAVQAALSARCTDAARHAFSMEAHGKATAAVYENLLHAAVRDQIACAAS